MTKYAKPIDEFDEKFTVLEKDRAGFNAPKTRYWGDSDLEDVRRFVNKLKYKK